MIEADKNGYNIQNAQAFYQRFAEPQSFEGVTFKNTSLQNHRPNCCFKSGHFLPQTQRRDRGYYVSTSYVTCPYSPLHFGRLLTQPVCVGSLPGT